jgi:hypothetical protein
MRTVVDKRGRCRKGDEKVGEGKKTEVLAVESKVTFKKLKYVLTALDHILNRKLLFPTPWISTHPLPLFCRCEVQPPLGWCKTILHTLSRSTR